MTADAPPLIGVPACMSVPEGAGGFGFHRVGDKYVSAVVDGAGGLALLIPALGVRLDRSALLDRLDGLLITGSPSNVEPHHYGGIPVRADGPPDLSADLSPELSADFRKDPPESLIDPARDATVLPLIREAVAQGIPLFAICRGIQELNVALGGTLHQAVHAVPGRIDHRSDKTVPMHERYGPAHRIALAPGGRLQTLLRPVVGDAVEIEVNSLHGQGIHRLAPGLLVEATAPDGTIEAVSVVDARAFALGVQWHPEWRVLDNPVSARLFAAFGAACRARAGARVQDGHGAMAAGA